jgi:hypothetical protein
MLMAGIKKRKTQGSHPKNDRISTMRRTKNCGEPVQKKSQPITTRNTVRYT